MPRATNGDVTLFYETDGERGSGGDGTGSDAPLPVVFVGDVGFGAWQWSAQHGELVGPRQTLVWDLRGTGTSDAPAGPYTVSALAADLEAVLADAAVERAHLVGAGLGGAVALRYAREYGRARSLALFGTPPAGDAVDEDALRALHPAERTPAARRDSLSGAFSAAFRTERSALIDQLLEWRETDDAGPAAVDAQIAALLGFEAGPLVDVALPALVGQGVDDPVVPPSAGETLAEGLPRGEYVPIEGRHLAHLESGTAVSDRLVAFFEDVETGETAR